MSEEQIIRAWQDETYRAQLSEEERAKLPPNPAGETELTDEELSRIQGGTEGGGPGPFPTLTSIGNRPHHHDGSLY